jgi:hypothetical protein
MQQSAHLPGAISFATNFSERRLGEVRLSPGPMGENFSGSWSVTNRNSLLHDCYAELRRIVLPRTPMNKGDTCLWGDDVEVAFNQPRVYAICY